MNFIFANILSKKDMKEARTAIMIPSKQLRADSKSTIKAAFKNSYVDVNYTLHQLGFEDRIGTYISKRDANLILEYAKEELKLYKKINNFYVKFVWNWTTDHTIIVLILIELIMPFLRH